MNKTKARKRKSTKGGAADLRPLFYLIARELGRNLCTRQSDVGDILI